MDKTAIIVVPHQDDEINLVGNIFDKIVKQFTTYVIYGSIDSNVINAKIRKEEAIEACSLWGIGEEHVFFLGYPDTANAAGTHFYTTDASMARGVVDELKKYIYDLKPDVIFATDFDFHSDHRMISMAFDKAMGEIVKEDVNYTPTIYKGFCYETAFYGPEDYVASAPSLSKATNENLLSNVSYLWDERVSICGDVKRRFIWNTKVFKGLKKHKSQYAVLHARSIVNADNVFWIKRTDNLLRKANISTTSGDESKLNDFMVIDTDDIITKDPLEISYDRALWKPNENACEIAIEFDEPQDITEIIFHGNPVENKKIPVQIEIYDEKGFQTKINSLEPYGRATKIALSISRASKLIFKLSDYLEDFGLSEIELFDGEFKGHFDNQPPVNMSYSNNSIINAIDLLGYKFIVLIAKIQRKIKKLFV